MPKEAAVELDTAAPVADKTPKQTPEEIESDRVLTEAEASPEKIEEMRKEFAYRQGFGPKPPEPVEKKDDKELEKNDEKPAAETTEKTEETKKPEKKSKAKVKVETPSTEAIAAAVRDGVTEAVNRIPVREPAPEKAKPAETTTELSASDQATIAVLNQLEKVMPEHKGIADRTVKFWTAEQKYVEKWQTDHPGEKFEQNAEEHQSFYEKNEPFFEPHDFERAKEALLEERILSKANKEHKAEIDRVRLEHQYERALPQIMQSAGAAVTDFVALAHPDFDAIMTVNGRRALTPEIIQKFDEADKEATDVLEEAGERLRMEIAELETISRFSGSYKIDPNRKFTLKSTGKSAYIHRDIQDFAENLESELAKSPVDETTRDGKAFLTQAQYLSKMKQITSANPEKDARELAMQDLQNRTWVLEPQNIRAALIADRAENARNQIARMNQRVERSKASNGAPPENAKAEAGDETPAKTVKTKPPSSAVVSDKVNTQETGKVGEGITVEQMEARMWGTR